MPTTGIGPIDNLGKLILSIFVILLFVLMGGRLIKMLHRHEYAQLISTLMLFGVALWFIIDPASLIGIFKSIFSGAANKLGGGGGGAGTGQ
jgi:hypothetical protein